MGNPSIFLGDLECKSSYFVVKFGLEYYLKGADDNGDIILTRTFDDALRFKDFMAADNAGLLCGGDAVQMFVIEEMDK